MDQPEGPPPGGSVQNGNCSAVIPHGEELGVGAELIPPDSRLQFCIFTTRIMRLPQRTNKLSVRGVEQKTPTMRRRLPEQNPLAIRGPGQSLRIDSFW